MVAAAYGPGAAAKLGVVGPTRMDYPGTMAAVRAVARYLSRILSQPRGLTAPPPNQQTNSPVGRNTADRVRPL